MPARNDITEEILHRLAETRAEGPVVLSVYLDLNPERFATPPARATEITSVLDTARRKIDSESAQLTHDQRKGLRGDLERVERHLRANGAPSGAHGLAVFCCSALELFESLGLPAPVQSAAYNDFTPHIAPLAEIGSPHRWCVALVNRRSARILCGSESELEEVIDRRDDVHGRHKQGGWSQANYERSVEEDAEAHLKRVGEALLEELRGEPFVGLLVGAPQELRHEFEHQLHAYVKERLVGYVDLDVENSSREEVLRCADRRIAEHRRQQVAELLERLRGELGREGRAVAGVEGVLGSLEERRVQTLFFEPRQHIAGAVCPACGLLSGADGECPRDGSELDQREDVLENAIEAAVTQSAEVVPVTTPDLGPLGGIAALLRF